MLTEDGSAILSPNYPLNYDNNELCEYSVQAPADKAVELSFEFMDIESSSSSCYDSLKVNIG